MRIIIFIVFFLSSYLANGQLNISCSNWLNLPNSSSFVRIGDLDIPGNKITVEAIFSRTTAYSGGPDWAGDLVSKHDDPSDVNYLLRPNGAEITTNNGYFKTPNICEIELNKTYHAAMVYDGTTLKFYRNGFLMSQIAATGNLVQNNWQTQIGLYEPAFWPENFIGYINEVRIWNVARSQYEIRAYMNGSLPNPTAQPGLLAYYTFNNLINKQGNTAWNGTLVGAASLNASLPGCDFVADSCAMAVSVPKIINDYTPVTAIDPCTNIISVTNAAAFSVGDTVLLIQMMGAAIDSSNSAGYGDITDYRNAGNYEFNYIKSISGNSIELLNIMNRSFDLPDGKVQLIRVPYFTDLVTDDILTCLPWDGEKGGVLVFNVQNTLTLNNSIDVSYKGFRGGALEQLFSACSATDYFYAQNSTRAALKGEGIFNAPVSMTRGRGKAGNGGGSGGDHNSGGAGGGNAGSGGLGGREASSATTGCPNPQNNGGVGGAGLLYNNTANKIFMGGGGGAGDRNGLLGGARGGNGGGIVIIQANQIIGNGHTILSAGEDAGDCTTGDCWEGFSGGGAGGTILLSTNSFSTSLAINTDGGDGGSLTNSNSGAGFNGPGGGGGGGLTWFSSPTLPTGIGVTNTGGVKGLFLINSDDGSATNGSDGNVQFGLSLPLTSVPFTKNIDSVRIQYNTVSCSRFDFAGLAYVQNTPVQSWFWNLGDGNTSTSQNLTHDYSSSGTFDVKLVVTDGNGCKDSITIQVVAAGGNLPEFSFLQDACSPYTVEFIPSNASAPTVYWDFGDGNTSTISGNQIHTYNGPGDYLVRYSIPVIGCADTLDKLISIRVLDENIILTSDTTICPGTSKQLRALPGLNYCWTPDLYLDDPNAASPTTTPPHDMTYYVVSESTGPNLIVNGDFSAGNTGFTSTYSNSPSNGFNPGVYTVSNNITAWHSGMSPCSDHTTGNGNMLLINGADVPDVEVWRQTINVTPQTNYAFSTWIQHITTVNPARLQFSINGVNIGSVFQANTNSCVWEQFYSVWNSGSNTTAEISIVNQNTNFSGNDFALDDISFAAFTLKRDSVRVYVDSPSVRTIADTSFCQGGAVSLNTTGATQYTWTPATGLSGVNIADPLASPTVTTTYYVSGINAFGCEAKDTVTVGINPLPSVSISPDTLICNNSSVQLNASGGINYSWSPASGLDQISIPNPVATPNTPTRYYVLVTDANNCSSLDSVDVGFRPNPVFSISPNTSTCINDPVTLQASGGDFYDWQPAGSLNNPGSPNPVANPATTTQYTVTITESVCNISTQLTTEVVVNPLPDIQILKSNDIDCSNDQSQLIANGSAQYSWTPSSTLNNPSISNPIASPSVTTKYFVTGTDQNGCLNMDSIVVNVDAVNKGQYLMPTGFTPNGDGLNDCYGIRYWGLIQSLEFSIYNRWGERVFYTTNPGDCWDGTFRGKVQDSGVFVYMIKAKTACESEVFRKGTLVLIR